MAIRENIIKLRNIFGLTQASLADIAGVSRGAVSQWESGFSEPRMGAIQRMADHFGLSKSHLIEDGGMDFVDPITKQARPFNPVRSITPRPFTKTAPVAGRIAAGDPRVAIELTDERRGAPDDLVDRYPQGFFLRVSGDGMDKVLPDGAFVFINGVPDEVHTGDIAAVKVNGDDATIKRVQFFEGVIILVPESTNPAHQRRIIDSNSPDAPEVRILGRAMWVDYALVNF